MARQPVCSLPDVISYIVQQFFNKCNICLIIWSPYKLRGLNTQGVKTVIADLDLDRAPIILLQGFQDQGSQVVKLIRREDFG